MPRIKQISLCGEGEHVEPFRRTVPRHLVDWEGEYKLEGDALAIWRPCRLVDVSTAGTGLELLGSAAEETLGRQVTVAIKLRGTVKNLRDAGNGLRLGLQFIELTDAERKFLESLGR
jgi:hypothetical protein